MGSDIHYKKIFEHMLNGFAYCRMLFDSVGKPIDFIYLEINDYFEDYTGLRREAVIGRKVSEVVPGLCEQNPEIIETYGRVVKSGAPETFETFVKPLERWLRVSVFRTEKDHFAAIFENISERKKIAQALEESEERFRLLFNLSNDGAMVHSIGPEGSGPFEEVNEAACRMLGYTRQELLSMTHRDIDAPGIEGVAEASRKVNQEGYVVFEGIHIAKDGHRIPVEISSRVLELNQRKYAFSLVRDITHRATEKERLTDLVAERTRELSRSNKSLRKEIDERKKAQAELAQSEEHFRALYEKMPVAYQSLDVDGRIIEVNPLWLEMLGYSREEVIGKWFGDFLADDQVTGFRERFTGFKQTGEVETEFRMKRSNREEIWVAITGRVSRDRNGVFKHTHCLLVDVTQKRRTEEEIRQLASFPVINPNPVLRVSPQGLILFANPSSGILLDYWKTRVGETLPDDWTEIVDQIYCSGIYKNIEIETRGKTFDLAVVPYQEEKFLNIYALEVTRRKQMARDLEISEENYRMLFDNTSDALILWEEQNDGSMAIMEANRVALERYGYSHDEMLKLKGQDLNSPESLVGINLPERKKLFEDGYAIYELVHRTKSGKLIPVEVYGHYFELNKKHVVLSVVRDISERKQAEIEKEKYQSRLERLVEERTRSLSEENKARQKAEMELLQLYQREHALSSALKEQIDERVFFTRALVHELRTPLTPLLGSSEMLLGFADQEPLTSLVRNIHNGALKLNKRIEQLLDLARGETGSLKLEYSYVDITGLLKDTIRYIGPQADSKGIAVKDSYASKIISAYADEEYLSRVLLNLFDNALKHTPRGGKISVSARAQDGFVKVSVKDSGRGIPKEKIDKLFLPYSQIKTEDASLGGLGLGLALCKMIIDLHGGKIWIESEPGAGVTVVFTIPKNKPKGEHIDENPCY